MKLHLEGGDMAEKKLEKGSAEWQFFQDFWKFRQKYHDPYGENDDWYDELIRSGESLINKYKDTDFARFARKMVLCHFDDVDAREKESRRKRGVGS